MYTKKVVVDVYGPDMEEFVEHIMNHAKTASQAFNIDMEQDVHDHDSHEDCGECYDIHDNSRRA